MRASAHFLIYLTHFGREFHLAAGIGVQPRLGPVQLLVGHRTAHHEAELGGAGLAVGVGVVSLAGGIDRPLPVENAFVQPEFRRDAPIGLPVPQQLAGLRILRIRIAALDDEIVNHPMEQEAVEIMLLRQLDEIVPVQRRFVVQLEFHGSHGRFDDHHDLFLRFRGTTDGGQHGRAKTQKQFFHIGFSIC